MDLRQIRQLVSLRDVRNAIVGSIVVFGGIGLAILTLVAHRMQNPALASVAAGSSLLFVLLILIFVVPPLARNASKEASQLDLPFEFTLGGAVFLVLIAIVAFSAWNTGNNLLFLILSFLTGILIVGFFAGVSSLKKLEVRMRFPEVIIAGEMTSVRVSIRNRKRLLPSYSIVAEVRGRERERSVVADELERILPKRIASRISRPPIVRRTLDFFAYIPGQGTDERAGDHIFENRGRFLIRDFELSTRFPFGFFRHRRRLPARETELIVFPKIRTIDNTLDDIQLEAGSLVSSRRGSGQDLLSLREYRPNDDLRSIDWKATARTRSLTVREFAAEDDKKVVIFLDSRVEPDADDKVPIRQRIEAEQTGSFVASKRFEGGASIAASLLTHFYEQQAETALVIGGEAGEFGIGRRHFLESMRQLAIAEPDIDGRASDERDDQNADEMAARYENAHSFVVTSSLSPAVPEEILQRSRVIRY